MRNRPRSHPNKHKGPRRSLFGRSYRRHPSLSPLDLLQNLHLHPLLITDRRLSLPRQANFHGQCQPHLLPYVDASRYDIFEG